MNKVPYLSLFEGETITGKGDNITKLKFSKSEFPLNDIETNTTTYKKTQELTTFNLLKCLKKINELSFKKINFVYNEIENCSFKNLRSIFKEIYKRIIIPFYIPVLMLIPFILIITSKESSKYVKLKYFTFLIGLFFIIFSETTIRLISTNNLFNYIVSAIPIFSLILLYTIFLKKFNLNPK